MNTITINDIYELTPDAFLFNVELFRLDAEETIFTGDLEQANELYGEMEIASFDAPRSKQSGEAYMVFNI